MNTPLVSVVIPSRNRASLLRGAVQSVLRQELRNIEVLVVDDASTDRTQTMAADWLDDRVTYLRNATQMGVASALNRGILHATGDWVAFLGDDDYWHPKKLNRQLEVLGSAPKTVCAVYTAVDYVDSTNGRLITRSIPRLRGDVRSFALNGQFAPHPSSVLATRASLLDVGLHDEKLSVMEDVDLWLRLSARWEFDFVEEPLTVVRRTHSRLSRDDRASVEGRVQFLEKWERTISPRFEAAVSSRIGASYCRLGETVRGRSFHTRALRVNPNRPVFYARWLASWLPPAIYRVMSWVFPRVRLAAWRRVSLGVISLQTRVSAAPTDGKCEATTEHQDRGL